ncbi:hypothetical protein AZE42_03870 [Rhizopogon vesiculosus]|uniref:Uncharacterized protein n=1 Tax=Rhizopogon vesiculosus TaxID=180088 RepID=A0A1J8R1E4_9AGAM|nr:hypothetical protein AZE42_03870 [Rhizopogon vesiculosus]
MGKASKTSHKRAAFVSQEERRNVAKSSSKKKHKQQSREQADQARHVLDLNAQTVYEAIGRPTKHSNQPRDDIDHVKALTETIMSL